MNVRRKFAKYVSQNILGMIGISLYILADTFFITIHEAACGFAVWLSELVEFLCFFNQITNIAP